MADNNNSKDLTTRRMKMSVQDLKKRILPVLEKYGIKRAGLFGSVVKGEEREDSDVDILVELPYDASLLELSGLKIELEELIGKKVDVLTYESLYPLLREPILSEEIVIL